MHPKTTQLEMPLRRALRRAGLVSGSPHKCRKKDCGYVLAATDPASALARATTTSSG